MFRRSRGPVDLALAPVDNALLANLCGALDENIRRSRPPSTSPSPAAASVSRSAATMRHGGPDHRAAFTPWPATRCRWTNATGPHRADQCPGAPGLCRRKTPVDGPQLVTRKGRAARPYASADRVPEAIQAHDITFGIGPAGTGKTYLAVASAVDAFERDLVERIVLTRPGGGSGRERLGFLPGDLAQKVDPYLRPLYDALYDLMGYDRVSKLYEKGAIEIAPLAFMRGRTLNHAFIILDEAQNTTPEQMKMFLTRIGIGAKAVVTGDLTQVDLPKGQKSGLREAREVLREVRGLAFTEFLKEDVVRHPW